MAILSKMKDLDRRSFLKLASGCLVPLLPGCSGSGTPDPYAGGELWGDTPAGLEHSLLPEERRPDGILEVFLMGGLSPWESFYTVPGLCDPGLGGPFAGQQWWTFQDGVSPNVGEWFEQCEGSGRDLYEPFARDAMDQMVNLGPFVAPLRDRPDILARMRVWVMAHPLEPHDAAIPYSVAGLPISNPRMAGFGTHIQRFFAARAAADRSAPFSYSIFQNSLNRLDLGAPSTALGLHPAAAQPIAIQLGDEPTLPRQLARPGVSGNTGAFDALIDHYGAAFRERLRQAGADTRAPAFADYLSSRYAMGRHQALLELLPPDLFEREELTMCSRHPAYHNIDRYDATDETGAAIRMARHLLTAGENAARYVQVLDGGIYPNANGQGYDSHDEHVLGQGANVSHLCRRLAEVINEPGEGDPNKLDLDRHFVLLNTEFGRSPTPEVSSANPNGFGTNHWPWGYVIVGFGGPIDSERAGVVGAIGEDSTALVSATPTEHRAALLLSMGIWPFTEESFAVGDIQASGTELDAALAVKSKIMGYDT